MSLPGTPKARSLLSLPTRKLARIGAGDIITKVCVHGSAFVFGTVQGCVFLIPDSAPDGNPVVLLLLRNGGEAITGLHVENDLVSALVGDRRLIWWQERSLLFRRHGNDLDYQTIPIRSEHNSEICSRTHIFQSEDIVVVMARANAEGLRLSLKSMTIAPFKVDPPLHIQSIPIGLCKDKLLLSKPKGDFMIQNSYRVSTGINANFRIMHGPDLSYKDDYIIYGDCCFILSPAGDRIYSFDSVEKRIMIFTIPMRTYHAIAWNRGRIISMRFCNEILVILDSLGSINTLTQNNSVLQTYELGHNLFDYGDQYLGELLWFPRGSKGVLIVNTGHELHQVSGLDWLV